MNKFIKIILLEDDEALSIGIEYSLKKEGYQVHSVADVAACLDYIEANIDSLDYTVAIFDVMLPDGNGFNLFKTIRNMGLNIPVIFLTAMGDENNIVEGLDMGADDYIAKPFRVRELMARLNAVIRRSFGDNANSEVNRNHAVNGKGYGLGHIQDRIICYGDLVIDENNLKVKLRCGNDGYKTIELTANEYKLLLMFVRNQGIVLKRLFILESLFDCNGNFVDDNTLSVYVRRLREKIGDTVRVQPYIKTVHGVGYTMERRNV